MDVPIQRNTLREISHGKSVEQNREAIIKWQNNGKDTNRKYFNALQARKRKRMDFECCPIRSNKLTNE